MHLVRLATTPLKDEEFTTGNHKDNTMPWCWPWWVTLSIHPILVAYAWPLRANMTYSNSQNRKYITYCTVDRGGPSHCHRQHARKLIKCKHVILRRASRRADIRTHVITTIVAPVSGRRKTIKQHLTSTAVTKCYDARTVVSSSCNTWSYSLIPTQKMIAVTSSKQWIHFLRSDLWPPTSNNLQHISDNTPSHHAKRAQTNGVNLRV